MLNTAFVLQTSLLILCAGCSVQEPSGVLVAGLHKQSDIHGHTHTCTAPLFATLKSSYLASNWVVVLNSQHVIDVIVIVLCIYF